MAGGEYAVTAGWGHDGSGDAIMPSQGQTLERTYISAERTAMSDAVSRPARSR